MKLINKNYIAMEMNTRTNVNMSFINSKYIVDEIFNIIVENLKEGNKVNIGKFGIFKKLTTKPKEARNPKTGVKVFVPASFKIKFSPAKELKLKIKK